mgnify:CR=1 FL=1
MDFLELMRTRYTTKYYDASRTIPDEKLEAILECLRLTPTAVNIQSTVALVARTPEAKAKMRPGIKDFNLQRFDAAPVALLLCGRCRISDEFIDTLVSQERADGRLPTAEVVAERRVGMRATADAHSAEGPTGLEAWTGKQAYIALGTVMYAAKAQGIDSTALEGIDHARMDEIFNLRDEGLCAQVGVLLGYHAETDSNTLEKRPKSRLPLKAVCREL